MVPGGPYAEGKEWRLRSRYAVISGMNSVGYTPKDAGHIGFVDFNHKCINAITAKKNKENIKYCDWPSYVPYEWFLPSRSDYNETLPTLQDHYPDRVLVLWLNNNAFADNKDPLNMLGLLKKIITPQDTEKTKISFNVIGPHDSITLQRIYDEINKVESHELSVPKHNSAGHQLWFPMKHNYHHLTNSFIFSSSATSTNNKIEKNLKVPKSKAPLKWLDDRIFRTIITQDKLAKTLLCELALRGINPYAQTTSNLKNIENICKLPERKLSLPSSTKPHHIALIGQWDTIYSRNLMDTIQETIINIHNGRDMDEDEDEHKDKNHSSIDWVHKFNYLRGLDGVKAEHSTNNRTTEKKEPDNYDPHRDETIEKLRRPVGPNQFDYLRRLTSQLKHLDKEKTKEGGIKAIGILGNDTYDKLLILQALHKKFPKVIFFTTDLDARLLHPDEKEWARNLIVASPFGLKLHDDLQKSTPPFRDNYQTAKYLSTKLAVLCWQGEREACEEHNIHNEQHQKYFKVKDLIKKIESSPRLFEIGNHGAVDLSLAKNEQNSVWEKNSDDNIWRDISIILIVINLTIAIILVLYQNLMGTKRVIDRNNKLITSFFLYCFFTIFFLYFLLSSLLPFLTSPIETNPTKTMGNYLHPVPDSFLGEIKWEFITFLLVFLNLITFFLLNLVPRWR